MNSLTILFEAVCAKLDKVETQINDITERCSRRLDTQTYIHTNTREVTERVVECLTPIIKRFSSSSLVSKLITSIISMYTPAQV